MRISEKLLEAADDIDLMIQRALNVLKKLRSCVGQLLAQTNSI